MAPHTPHAPRPGAAGGAPRVCSPIWLPTRPVRSPRPGVAGGAPRVRSPIWLPTPPVRSPRPGEAGGARRVCSPIWPPTRPVRSSRPGAAGALLVTPTASGLVSAAAARPVVGRGARVAVRAAGNGLAALDQLDARVVGR